MSQTELQLSDTQFERISDVVYKHCGINLHDGKRELVQARLAKRMRTKALPKLDDYLRFAFEDREEFTHLIDALSTNLTSFFRENDHFIHLEKVFLPRLLERKKKAGRSDIRCWSAGCSTGEEPYTIAMTLLSALDPSAWDVKILATDLSTAVLAKAKTGVYESDRLQTIPPQLRSKFCVSGPGNPRRSGQMSPEIRKIISFAQLNLMQTWPFRGPFDFIFCRNVMIYFDKPTQEKLINRYYDILNDGGLLFTGHSESLTGVAHRFEYVKPTIYAKR
jgi:chemotaxis protein methyltransferase CheR